MVCASRRTASCSSVRAKSTRGSYPPGVNRGGVGLAVLSLGYAGGLLAAHPRHRPATWPVVAGAFVFRLTLWSLPGLFSTDIFSYVMYGRIAAVHAANPYIQPPADFASDPFLAWVFPFWRDQPSVYGPAWTDLSWLLSAASAERSNFEQVMLYRASISL